MKKSKILKSAMTEETMTEDNTVQAPGTAVVEKDGSTTKASSNDDLGKEARMPSKVSKDSNRTRMISLDVINIGKPLKYLVTNF